MVDLWTVGHMHLYMLGTFPYTTCQIILKNMYTAGSACKGNSVATWERQCLIVRISISMCLLPLNFTKKKAHTNSEMILFVWTWLTSSNSFMRSLPSIRGFVSISHRYSSLGHLTFTRSWRTCLSTRMGKLLYKTIEANLVEVVIINYIQRNVQSLEVFRHRKMIMLTKLNSAARDNTVCWADAFWFLWNSAKSVAPWMIFSCTTWTKIGCMK